MPEDAPMRHATGLFSTSAAFALLLTGSSLLAQDSTRSAHADKTFLTRRDILITGAGFAASVGVSAFDERIARWTQSSGVQGGSGRRGFFEAVTHANEVPLTIAATATWAIGRVSGSAPVADIGLHTAEALGLTIVMAELIRGPLGRARPRVAGGDAFKFDFNSGFTKFENRAYPSMHSAVAFTTAAALTEEMRHWKPNSAKYVAPVLYTAALIPGMTRMYLNQHWASDVVAGGVMGAWLGHKVVHYAHSHRRSRLDRVLLSLTVLPTPGGVAVYASRAWTR